jgi:surfactin synthase thioesterase subunit
MPCNASLWPHQAQHLAGIADTIIVETMGDDSIGAMVKQALDMATLEFVLAGLSMGGYVAIEFWRRTLEQILRLTVARYHGAV